jgi:hypothetical protein
MDASGFIDDWTNNRCRLRDGGVRDSTDAPAGLFLLALLAAQRSFPRTAAGTPQLPSFSAAITRALGAIEATQDADGLTWAKPGYAVKYLMDQSETYAGLVAAGELGRVLGNAGIADRATRDATRMRRGVDGLWDPAAGSYVWGVHATGERDTTSWSVLDPDALQQVWAVAFGLAGGDRGTRIMDRFRHEQSDWSRPAALARYRSGTKPTGYWAVAGWALLQTGAAAESQAAAASIRAAALAAGRAWPFSSGDAGQLILLESGDAGYLGNVAPDPETPSPTPPTPSATLAAPPRPGQRGRGGPGSVLLVAAGALALAGGWWLRRKAVAWTPCDYTPMGGQALLEGQCPAELVWGSAWLGFTRMKPQTPLASTMAIPGLLFAR